MAESWIKIRTNLWDDPRISSMADICDCGEAAIIGAAYWFWSMADEHTQDGELPGMSMAMLDRKTGVTGFASAMVKVGWLIEKNEGLTIPNFDQHNGQTAKRRAMTARRVEKKRESEPIKTDESEPCNAVSVTETVQERYLDKSKSKSKSIKEKVNKKETKSKILFDLILFPDWFSDLDYLEAFDEWLNYKIERGQGYKSTRGPNAILRKFEPHGADALVEAISNSIASNWAGLFEPDGKRGSPRQDNSPAAKRERTQQAIIQGGKDLRDEFENDQDDIPKLC